MWNSSNSLRISDLTEEQKFRTDIYFKGYGQPDEDHLWEYRTVEGQVQRTSVFRRNPDKSKTWIWPGDEI